MGRVTKDPIMRGTILIYTRLVELPKGAVPDDWQLLTVPYPSTTITPTAGQRVKLLKVEAGDDTPVVLSDEATLVAKADALVMRIA